MPVAMDLRAPSLSVIIPVCNGEQSIEDCLASVFASTYRSYEVIVVDDGSSDRTGEILQRFPALVIRFDRNLGPAAARNAGAAAANAPLLLFLDADIIVPPSFLGTLVERIGARSELAALFCCYTKETRPENTCSRFKNLVHHWTHKQALEEAVTFCGGFGIVRREVFVELGGFDASCRYLEDIDFGYRMHLAGYRIGVAKDLQVTHTKHYSLAGLIRSDLFARAVPWTRLMLKYRIFRNDLNTRIPNILSVAVACLLPVSFAAGPTPLMGAALCAILIALNWRFLRFAAAVHGLAFAVRSAVLCWLIYLLSAVGVILGLCEWAMERSGLTRRVKDANILIPAGAARKP